MEETAGLLKTNPSALMAFDRIESKAGGALPCNELGIERPDSQALRQEAPDLTELQQTAADAAQKAKECGVDIAKRGFFSKLLTLVAASAVLVAAALVTSAAVAARGQDLRPNRNTDMIAPRPLGLIITGTRGTGARAF